MKFDNIPTLAEWRDASSSAFQIRAHKPKLVRIDELVGRYPSAMDMGRLNVLMELKNAIIDWAQDKLDRDKGTGRLEAMQALLEAVIRKLYELEGWGKHRYLKAVCIGYGVKTGYYDPNLPPPSDVQRRADETSDVGASCDQLRGAIADANSAYLRLVATNRLPVDEDRKTLKIFMAPEFFFRGRYGAYGDIGRVSEVLEMMRSGTAKPEYADWLFVHGTVVVSTEKEVDKKKAGRILENFALVQKGGGKTGELSEFVVEKEYPSHVDFQHPGLSDWGWYDPSKSSAMTAGENRAMNMPEGGRKDPIDKQPSGKPVSELVGGVVFTMDGITFGLEVCRDHALHRLAGSQEKGKVLIQLIPSCGMTIEQDSIGCVPGGIVFNVDGGSPHVMVQLNSIQAVGAPITSNQGTTQIYPPLDIPWPKPVPPQVANLLKLSQSVLGGTAPIPPPQASKPRFR